MDTKKSFRKVFIIPICIFSVFAVLFLSTVGYAYFSKKEIYDGYMGAQVELLFDKLDDDGMAAYQTLVTDADPNAKWGTEKNPYIISNVKHLYNLAELQRLGYFYKYHVSENYINDTLTKPAEGWSVPYFRVCTTKGTPVTIDGNSFGKKISAIGTEEYPFIGSVKGAFATGTCEIEGKTSDTSAIYDVSVVGNPAYVDIGLFGHVGVLGTVPEDEFNDDGTAKTFEGKISEISNLLLYDVTVTVDSSLFDKITSFIEDHMFTFTKLSETDKNAVPHENHHIGILAGHVHYTKVEFISIYYSDDNIAAIDLSDDTVINNIAANYMSSSGVIGYIDNMNPVVDASGSIKAGSGTSNENLSYNSVGGGGLLSGNKTGYVLASKMYQTYHWTGTPPVADTSGTIFLKDALTEDGTPLCEEWVRERILWGTENTGRYYFYDGVFTFALSDTSDVIEDTWNEDFQDMSFSIGSQNAEDWETNYAKGNNAVAAFVKPITNDKDLNDAISAGKKLFIIKENDASIFLMDLSSQSQKGSGDPEEKYYTPGLIQYFGDAEFNKSIIESLQGIETSELVFNPDYMLEEYKDPSKIISDLQDGKLKTINVGISDSNRTVEELRQQYNITPTATGTFTYFDTNNSSVTVSGTTVSDYYDYSESDYDGYFYYTSAKGTGILDWFRTYYSYYWQPKNGESIQINEAEDESEPADFFTQSTNTPNAWNGETVYQNKSGTIYEGVVINYAESTFYDTGNEANPSGINLTKPTAETLHFFYTLPGETQYYYSETGDPVTVSESSTSTSAAGRPLYTAGSYSGVKLVRYPNYTFSHGDNYMRFMKLVYWAFGTRYTIWNGTDSAAETTSNFSETLQTPTVANSKYATVKFNSDGTCYISYSIDSTTMYIQSDDSTKFNSSAGNTSANTKLCIYTVEGTQDFNYGRITFDPKDETGGEKFAVDEYVFFANTKTTSGTDNGYSIIKLSDLGWNNGNASDNGGILHGEDIYDTDGTTLLYPGNLSKKFHMFKGITFGLNINILNGALSNSGFLQAPVGSLGVKANIPSSCVAFRINKAEGEKKIRVIVAVPTSEYYQGESANGTTIQIPTYTTYFNMWKMPEASADMIQTFEPDDRLDRFTLPQSYPYEPGTKPTDANVNYIRVNKGTIDADTGKVVAGDTAYNCSPNGDRILVAYEFTVTEDMGEGIYVLGMSGHDGTDYVEDVPMEIVYFSADGVASTGRDGNSASQLGSIDFVYDYNNKIVTVKEKSDTDSAGNEDYSNYYPSYVIMYFNNGKKNEDVFVDINQEYIRMRRWVNDSITEEGAIKSTITFNKTGVNHAELAAYARKHDNMDEVEPTQ